MLVNVDILLPRYPTQFVAVPVTDTNAGKFTAVGIQCKARKNCYHDKFQTGYRILQARHVGTVVPVQATKKHGGVEIKLHQFLTSTLSGRQSSASHPGDLLWGKEPSVSTE